MLKVLGAGLSGLTAAINLRNAGVDVQVFDRVSSSGRRFLGDLQGLENWTLKEDVLDEIRGCGVKTDFFVKGFDRLTITNGDEELSFRGSRPYFYLVKRGSFEGSLDSSLMGQARDLGIRINYNSRLPEKAADVVCTGPDYRSAVAQDLGTVFETDADDTAVLLLNDSAAFRGYSYLLVADGYGCLCSVVFGDRSRLNGCYQKTAEFFRDRYGIRPRNPHRCGGIGGFSMVPRSADGKRLYAGEAAGLQDFLWGFGIRSAIVSGFLAARSIVGGMDYPRLIEKRFGGFLKASVVNRFLWERYGSGNYSKVLGMLKSSKDLNSTLHRAYNFSVAHRLLLGKARRSMRAIYSHSGL
ncbi:MAG: NAD(P)/FAD-dependent oxidoreductase [Candidatus Micrarchaeota archaeon]|nr:NAD(P)/FAD-dependent oxidoreductase [Candidatus Micrarchaeota archaeon]